MIQPFADVELMVSVCAAAALCERIASRSVSASAQSTALWTSSMLDAASPERSCCASCRMVSDANADEPNTTIRVSGGECSESRGAGVAGLAGSGFSDLSCGLATALVNPPDTATAITWLPFLSAATSLGPANPVSGNRCRSGATAVDALSHAASDDVSSASTWCTSSPTLGSALTG